MAGRLSTGIDYRQREATVRHLASRTRWYATWARAHHPSSPAASRCYALIWLWTEYAAGLLATSPDWSSRPTVRDRAYCRRYAARLTSEARAALIDLATERENCRRPP